MLGFINTEKLTKSNKNYITVVHYIHFEPINTRFESTLEKFRRRISRKMKKVDEWLKILRKFQ